MQWIRKNVQQLCGFYLRKLETIEFSPLNKPNMNQSIILYFRWYTKKCKILATCKLLTHFPNYMNYFTPILTESIKPNLSMIFFLKMKQRKHYIRQSYLKKVS